MSFFTTSATRPCILTVLSGGGFTFEAGCLLQDLASDCDIVYLKTCFGGTLGEGRLPAGESHLVPDFASVTRPQLSRSVKAFFSTFFTAGSVMRRRKIDLVVSVGCSHAVPMLLAARLFGLKTVYMESITRADRLSRTGRLVYGLGLAKTFLVQWPGLQARYPASRLGTIL